MATEEFWDRLLGLGIILLLILIAYLKWTNRTIGDFIKDLRGIGQNEPE